MDVNIRDFGALGDPAKPSRDALAFQNAIKTVEVSGGGTIIIPKGTYYLEKSIYIHSNITFQGAGLELTTIRHHADLRTNPLILIQGTYLFRVKNIRIRGITFKNGEARQDHFTPAKDAIRTEYVDGLLIEDCKFTEIEGAYGVVIKYTTNVTVQRNQFYYWTYAALCTLVECENIHVLNNNFDTAVLMSDKDSKIHPYTFAVGYEKEGEGSFFVKNLWVENNKFMNNPSWSGIDCHGGENINIRNNYVENVRIGIHVGLPRSGIVTNPVLRNVHIENNTLIQGSGLDDHYGIVFTSAIVSSPAENGYIKDNKITGFGQYAKPKLGDKSGSTIGAITVYNAKNVYICDNEIDNYAQAAIMLNDKVYDCKIFQNRIRDARGATHPDSKVAIHLQSWGLYGISIKDNVVEPSSLTGAPKYFILAGTAALSVQIANNMVKHILDSSLYVHVEFLPVKKSSITTDELTQKYGDIIYNDKDKPGWYVLSPRVGYGSLITDVIGKVNIMEGSNYAVISNIFKTNPTDPTKSPVLANDYRWLPEGMNIYIKGAGPSGNDLEAYILKNDGSVLTLNQYAHATVFEADVKYKPFGYVEI